MGASVCHGDTFCGLGGQGGPPSVQHNEMRPRSRRDAYDTSGTPKATGSYDQAKQGLDGLAGADLAPSSVRLAGGTQNSLDFAGLSGANAHQEYPGATSETSPGERDSTSMHVRDGAVKDAANREVDETEAAAESLAASYFLREAAELQNLNHFGGGPLVRTRMKHIFKTGAVYDGQWLGNERDGFGKQTWPDGAEYVGEWKHNVVTGIGAFAHSDGDSYVGTWRDNLAHGHGTYIHQNGTVYRGTFNNDLQDGEGVEQWPDNSQYIGEFSRGKKSGTGVYMWPDGSKYEGSWCMNMIDGAGKYTGTDGRCYNGNWMASTMHGCGRYEWVDGRCYKGQYVMDQKEGFGIFTWADGRRYEGFWAKGRQHGIGRICNTQSRRLAQWEHGERKAWLEEENVRSH
eukprot:gb/GFBE01027831.1/.p1 GENE.gb/GFBE01027831.1/~~gb/GFBE01027831.1/.p1  ORF type:complete len:401 (+),score=63.84 gb/GFBE01027831.1/:1-1203(+)